ncbi:MAG: DNA repair protein RecO [Candidatus Rokubacteria bacterium]|nr:DNA repair protein RecO [Candidatus Rokubacteria bacterium]
MSLIKTQGIVIGRRALGERDRLVTFYTRELGKLSGVARGARRGRSRFGAALELFTWGELVAFEPAQRDLVRIDHFDVHRPFQALREDLERLGQGAAMVEALARLTAERDPHPALFGLLLRGLRALERGSPRRVHLAFTLRLLDLLGHRPRLDRCLGCRRPVGAGAWSFDAIQGRLACARCRAEGALPLSTPALATLRRLQTSSWEERLATPLAPAAGRELEGLLERYLAALIGSALRVPRFVAQTRAVARRGP